VQVSLLKSNRNSIFDRKNSASTMAKKGGKKGKSKGKSGGGGGVAKKGTDVQNITLVAPLHLYLRTGLHLQRWN
jgi:hypothetical protein